MDDAPLADETFEKLSAAGAPIDGATDVDEVVQLKHSLGSKRDERFECLVMRISLVMQTVMGDLKLESFDKAHFKTKRLKAYGLGNADPQVRPSLNNF